MGFLGRKLTGHFLGEIISDMKDGGWGRRIPGARIKHRVKENWLKMYDKDGSVLRVEMVINNPEEFKVRKKVSRKNKRVLEWVSMRKGVAYLFRYREVSQQANYRYLEALAVVDDPTPAIRQLDDITTEEDVIGSRRTGVQSAFARDIQLFRAMMAGEHHIRGLSNADIRMCLQGSMHLQDLTDNPRKQSARVSRILSRFHAHKLIAKIPHTTQVASDRPRKANHGGILVPQRCCFPELFRKNTAA